MTHPFIQKLNAWHTSWHTVENIENDIISDGYEKLPSASSIERGKKYYISNRGFLFAFVTPKNDVVSSTILLSHTDSPSLYLRPTTIEKHGVSYLDVEPYGGPLLSSYITCPLHIAGKVVIKDGNSLYSELFYDIETLFEIPTPPIHLLKEEKGNLIIDASKHLYPILGYGNQSLLKYLIEKTNKTVVEHDLFLIPAQKATHAGVGESLVRGYGIDNKASVYASLNALQSLTPDACTLQGAIFFNHEEIGSATAEGASSSFPLEILRCIYNQLGKNLFIDFIQKSKAISLDNAHAIQFGEERRYDSYNTPQLSDGICIKMHANRKYASSAELRGFISNVAKNNNIKTQNYAPHKSIPAGSTLGPLFEKATGIEAIDVGISQLSMHATSEICSLADVDMLSSLCTHIFSNHEQ